MSAKASGQHDKVRPETEAEGKRKSQDMPCFICHSTSRAIWRSTFAVFFLQCQWCCRTFQHLSSTTSAEPCAGLVRLCGRLTSPAQCRQLSYAETALRPKDDHQPGLVSPGVLHPTYGLLGFIAPLPTAKTVNAAQQPFQRVNRARKA